MTSDRTAPARRFYIKTYGCQMNLRDSDSAAALLIEHGWTPADGEADADLVILNTCSVRDQAERKAVGKLGFLGKLKRERPWMIFGIMGCMAQNRGAELLKSIRHLDFVIGTGQIHRIPEVVDEVEENRVKRACLEHGSATDHGIDAHRFDGAESPHSAFVSIMRGCSRYCSYCIVRFVSGPEISRPMDSILAECRMLADHGVPEIFLLGQNVSAYGLDNTAPPPDDAPSPFACLLRAIAEIDGVRRIRFTSPHPAYFTQALIDAFTQTEKVCKYVHLPLQSGSNRILKLMNRPYDTAKYLSIADRMKERCPEMSFSTDVIVGFPTETEADFQATRELMDRVGFDNAYIFKYSPRSGTRSAQTMPDDVPQEVKEERNQILLADLERRAGDANRKLIGRTFELLVEGPSKRNAARWSGRTDTFKQAVFTPDPENPVESGDFVRVKIVRATPTTLYGKLVADDDRPA